MGHTWVSTVSLRMVIFTLSATGHPAVSCGAHSTPLVSFTDAAASAVSKVKGFGVRPVSAVHVFHSKGSLMLLLLSAL